MPGRVEQWRDISPSQAIVGQPGDVAKWWISLAIDPGDSNILYAGQCEVGVWKSSNRGVTWNLISTSPSTSIVDTAEGKVTTFISHPGFLNVDPKDSTHLYAAGAGWGCNGYGFWESRDSGKTWLMPKTFIDQVTTVAKSSDVGRIAIDPEDFGHILISIRYRPSDAQPFGFFEGKRTGNGPFTFTTHAAPGPLPASTIGIDFLSCKTCKNHRGGIGIGNGNTWLISSELPGYWRTENAGQTWQNVLPNKTGIHGGINSHYYTGDGVLYMGAWGNPLRSSDNGITWEDISNIYAGVSSFAGNGKYLFASSHASLVVSPETDGLGWTLPGKTFDVDPVFVTDPKTNTIFATWSRKIWMLVE